VAQREKGDGFGKVVMAVLLVALAGWFAGCEKPANQRPEAFSVDALLPKEAQPTLQTMKIWLGPEEMVVELAVTPEQERAGMMFRTNLAENAGMLFALPVAQRASFWMKNCPLPLSAAYIDPEGIIQEIHNLEPFNTNAVEAATSNIRFVLETSQGWFQRHHIGPGTAVRTERGPLLETFFGRR